MRFSNKGGKMCRKALLISFLSILLLSTFLVQGERIATRSEMATSQNHVTNSLIVINETQYTWYGDFVVNETDTVIIENCNFTVENGMIYVYGRMNATNSTIWMRNVSLRYKNIVVYGNFTMSNSKILGNNLIICDTNSNVQILNSSSPTTLCMSYTNKFYVYNSVLRLINIYNGTIHLLNSNLSGIIFPMYTTATLFASNCSINYMILELCYKGDLEIRPGLIENLKIYYDRYPANFTIINSFVNGWEIYCYEFEGKLINSIIDVLGFGIDPVWSGNLTLTSGYIECLKLNCSYTPFVIENSTVNEWRIDASGNASIQFLDSKNIDLDILGSAKVSMLNSYILYLCAYEDFLGSILATNTTINSFNIRFYDCSSNLSLKEGFYEFFNIYIPEHGCNMTLINSTVEHWWIQASRNSTLNIFNSTLTKDLIGWCPYNLGVYRNSSCSVYNSNIEVIFCSGSTYYQLYPTLTIVNCTVKTLYAYNGANVTAINSTINMLITDPINVNLINSNILLALDSSIEMTHEDSIASQFMGECDPPLPKNIQRFSQYINITTAYDDYFETQVRIYYDETKIKEAGINENWLQMYYLDESYIWRLCQVQGVNATENYVWANVTHFSIFVLGFRVTCTPWEVVIVDEYTIYRYGLTITCIVGYMKRTCNLPGYAITYRPWKACDIS